MPFETGTAEPAFKATLNYLEKMSSGLLIVSVFYLEIYLVTGDFKIRWLSLKRAKSDHLCADALTSVSHVFIQAVKVF